MSIAGIAALSAGPAFADSNINYFQGGGSGQAINLQVAPNALLSGVDLSAVAKLLQSGNSAVPGLGDTLYNNLGGTLTNVDSPVTVVVDNAQVGAKAANGTQLTDGLLAGAPGLGAISTPVDINAKALQSELQTLKQALQNMPTGTDAAIKQALQPLLAANPSLASVVGDLDPLFSQQVSDTLGAPTVSLQGISANLANGVGQDNTHGLLTVNGAASPDALLNPGSTYTLDPFEARALPTDALADNKVTSLALVGTGKIQLPTAVQLANAVNVIDAAVQKVEQNLLSTAGQSNGVVSLTPATGVAATVITAVNKQTNQAIGTVQGVNLSAVNSALNAISDTLNSLIGLNGLELSDLLANNNDTARATLQRVNAGVTATGHSGVVDLSAVNLHTGPLADLVGKITSAAGLPAGSSLVGVSGVTGDASVTLDGVNTAKDAASGSITSISVLGKTILGQGGLANLDDYLPQGTQCVITVPAVKVMQCTGGVKKSLDLSSTLGPASSAAQAAFAQLPALTITLTRGAPVYGATDSVTMGHAAITELEVTVDLASGPVLQGAVNSLNLPVELAGPAPAGTSQPHLVDLQMGVASANISLTAQPGQNCVTGNCSTGAPLPPTGNDIVPLGILAAALLAGGIGIGVRQRYAVRRG